MTLFRAALAALILIAGLAYSFYLFCFGNQGHGLLWFIGTAALAEFVAPLPEDLHYSISRIRK